MQLLSLARCSSKGSQLSTRQSVTAQAKTRTISGGVLGEWLKLLPCSPKHTIHLIHALQTGTHAWSGGTWQGPATDRWLRNAHGSPGLTLRQPLTLCQPSQVCTWVGEPNDCTSSVICSGELPLLQGRAGEQGDGVKRSEVESEVDTPNGFV